MGLSGSGKTYFANCLKTILEKTNTVQWLNADRIREEYNDWDFSYEGRIRQSIRMKELADKSTADYVIADFIAPLPEMRNNFRADFTIWMDTVSSSQYVDTDGIFIEPKKYDFRITQKNAEELVEFVSTKLHK